MPANSRSNSPSLPLSSAVQIQRQIIRTATEGPGGLDEFADNRIWGIRVRRSSGIRLHQVDSQRDSRRRSVDAPGDDSGTVIRNAIVDDDGLVCGQAKQARPWIAGRRLGGNRADFDEAEELGQGADSTAALVEAGGQADGSGEVDAGHVGGQTIVGDAHTEETVHQPSPACRGADGRSQTKRRLVYGFGVYAEQQGAEAVSVETHGGGKGGFGSVPPQALQPS